MNYKELAQLLFANIDKSPEYYEELYPVRNLKEGARVTRFALRQSVYLYDCLQNGKGNRRSFLCQS